MQEQLTRLVEGGVSEQELERVKRSTRRGLFDIIQSNKAMASALCSYSATTGSWRGLLVELATVEALTPQAVGDVAQQLFREDNCFRGYMLPQA